MLTLYKLVVRDKNGKVMQIHEAYAGPSMLATIKEETDKSNSVTITQLP